MSEFPAPASGFVAGFSARHEVSAPVLARAFTTGDGFAAVDVRDRITAPAPRPATPTSFSPQAPGKPGPRHYAPADRSQNPTEGWDPLDPTLPDPSLAGSGPSVDHVAQARAAGYAEGLAVAQETMAAAVTQAGERDRALLAGLVDQLATGGAIDRDALAAQLRQTVLLLVGKVVGEAGVSPDLLAGRIAAAVDHLSDKAESALLRVHPDDVALLSGRLPDTVFAAGDPAVARGSFVLETASTIVEDGPGLWLDQLAQAVDRVAVPSHRSQAPC
ncbi:FliH/SctL family protein [uncultured Sphingomonas sp.]|uniref:FliH/SctL family protein n=1 Tax=uncultured Sphingomonas sp. TaxID=158754 RepID=UPI0035CA6742